MIKRVVTSCLVSLTLLCSQSIFAASSYLKSTEGRDVVKNKIYPKRKKIELVLPNLGLVMNQSYVTTFIVGGGLNYFFSESWGVGVDFSLGINSDKSERTCIENFFYDPEDELGSPCSPVDGDTSLIDNLPNSATQNNFPRFGPAYVPIRELQYMISANLIWSPVYGKQLVFLSTTSYFDLFVEFGGGLAFANFYPKRSTLANGNESRGTYTEETGTAEQIATAQQANARIGALTTETDSFGINGRPQPETETSLMVNIGVGQKFHFGKKFHFKILLRNQTLLGTAQGFDNLFTIIGGTGFRL